MAKKKIVPIDYTSRDFNSIKADLVSYAKRYYPNVYKDFNEASFGSLLLDTVAYIGDMLSFYLDYSVNESFLETALEHDNVVSLARTLGYKYKTTNISHGKCQFYVLIPAMVNSAKPNIKYIPKLLKNSVFSTRGGTIFTLNEDIEFANPDNEITVASVDSNNMPEYYAIKASGVVISGDLIETTVSIGSFSRFLRVEIPGESISEIVSVFDQNGNEYFEVPYLSQNIIFKSIANFGKDSETTPNLLKSVPAPRRFVVEHFKDKTYLQFGYGSESVLSTKNAFADPSELVLDIHGKNHVIDSSFDPTKLLSTDKFGVVPSNVDLYVVYRTNTNENVNAGSNSVVEVVESDLFFR